MAYNAELVEHRIFENLPEDKYQRLFELAGDGILLLRNDLCVDCNYRAAEMLGYDSPEEIIGSTPYDISPERQPDGSLSREYAIALTKTAYRSPLIFEWVHQKKDGTPIDIEVSLTLFDQKQGILLCHWRDISDRKLAERSLSGATRLLERTGRLAHVGGWEYNEHSGQLELSHQLRIMLGLTEQDPITLRQLLRMIVASHRPLFFDYLKRLRRGEVVKTIDIEVKVSPKFHRWWRVSSEQIRLQGGSSLLTGAIQDITEVKTERLAKERKQQEIKQGQLQLMQAMSLALEKRDPYTAGHQSRVASLARAIAEKMGFDPERLEGLSLGATLHDMGKISVPAEILTRPGKLSKEEMDLIRLHPQTGYDIIKDVTFPWPIAEMVLQHQERFDGTGYPAGLKGDDIILEARIITVADVVEAMASHRPYREALGIDKALEEIRQQRGIGYDPQVVDACLEVFHDGYTLK